MNAAPDRRMDYFAMLEPEQQRTAIMRLAASGMSDHGIAAATLLSVEMVRQIMGPRRPVNP